MNRRAEILSWIGTRIGKPPGFERIVRFLMPIHRCSRISEICLVRDGYPFLTRTALRLGWHVAFFDIAGLRNRTRMLTDCWNAAPSSDSIILASYFHPPDFDRPVTGRGARADLMPSCAAS
jgi:hypothetical protein